MNPDPESLRVEPIGYVRSLAEKKYQLPAQPTDTSDTIEGVVELVRGCNYDVALRDLNGFSRIWLLWWFHKNKNWRPTTLPPRGRTGRKGTFATRSPYRPNPLALSTVKLLGVDGHTLFIGPHDLLDGTPVLDIKPYISEFDAFPEEADGWYGEMRETLPAQDYRLEFSREAEQTLNENPDLRARLTELLGQDPYPHRTRRIVAFDDGYRVALGDWRAYFRVLAETVRVERVSLRTQS